MRKMMLKGSDLMSEDGNHNPSWFIKPCKIEYGSEDVQELLIEGEMIEMAFQDYQNYHKLFLFTNKRIIMLDPRGWTKTKKTFNSMPYSKIQTFSIQTPGFGEIIPESKLSVVFSDTVTITFIFKGKVDIKKIGRMISEYVL